MVITFKGLPGKGDGHLRVGISESAVRSFLRRHKPETEKEVQKQRLKSGEIKAFQSLTAVVRIRGKLSSPIPTPPALAGLILQDCFPRSHLSYCLLVIVLFLVLFGFVVFNI